MSHTPLSGGQRAELSIASLLKQMVKAGASDLHLSTGSSPTLRIEGSLKKLHELDPPTPEKLRDLANEVMNDEHRATYEAEGDLDFAIGVRDLGRFRINVLRQRSSIGMVLRHVPHVVPSGDKLGLPLICRDLAVKPRGLVLVTGPTGSGKSTTLAAMIDYINTFQERHVLTLEDPIEFIHQDKCGIVTQREIGNDCPNFAQALRRAMRQDPDIIMVGELRDAESIQMAITAAETGHLVFSTMHTTTAPTTVDRLIDAFPAEAKPQARAQIAGTLQGVIAQCLLPKIGGGRVMAHEVLVATDAVRSMIRDGKTAQMRNALQTGRGIGMTTLEDTLATLVSQETIRLEDALAFANRPGEVSAQVGRQPTPQDESNPTPQN